MFVAHDGERCKLPAYHSLEGFQHIGTFQLFESCVFWLAFQMKVEGHHQQVVVTSNVCSLKTVFWQRSLLIVRFKFCC